MNCHQAGGVSSKDVRSEFDPAIAGTGNQTASGALANQRHDIFDADQTYSTGIVACADCHSPHADNASTLHNPDTGADVGLYSAAGYISGNADPTFGSTTQLDTIAFCLACHDGDGSVAAERPQAGSSYLSDGLISVGTTYTADFHGYGFGGSAGNGFLKPPYQIDTDYAPMPCTECHGAHGSDNIFNLRSSITVGVGTPSETVMSTGGPWASKGNMKDVIFTTYTLENANDGSTQAFRQWGAWCSFCHNLDQHSLDETKTCNGGHVHGAGKM